MLEKNAQSQGRFPQSFVCLFRHIRQSYSELAEGRKTHYFLPIQTPQSCGNSTNLLFSVWVSDYYFYCFPLFTVPCATLLADRKRRHLFTANGLCGYCGESSLCSNVKTLLIAGASCPGFLPALASFWHSQTKSAKDFKGKAEHQKGWFEMFCFHPAFLLEDWCSSGGLIHHGSQGWEGLGRQLEQRARIYQLRVLPAE